MTWKTKKLDVICDIEIGKTPLRSNKKFWDENKIGNNVWLSIADLLNTDKNIVTDSKEYISDEGARISKLVRKGALLASFKLTLGRLAFAGRDLYTNEAIAALTIRDDKEIYKDFLYYYLFFFDWDSSTKGDIKVKGKTLNKTKLKELEISFPPLITEQKRIVNLLNEFFEKIEKTKENTEKNLQNSRELFESYLQTIYSNNDAGWKQIKLSDACKISSNLVDPRKAEFQNLLYIGGANIESKSGKIISLKTAKEEKLISGKFVFDDSMVLYSKIRPYLMKVARPNFKGLCSADIYPLLPQPGTLDRDYLYYLLLTQAFTQYANLGSGRAGMPKINRNHLFEFAFVLPPISKQKMMVINLDIIAEHTRSVEDTYIKKLADLEELKKSVLQKVFAGEL
jgi:type I restriction enzyme S subunit